MKITVKLLALAAILGFAGTAFGQTSDTKNGSVGFGLALPIQLNYFMQDVNNSYIDFGTLIPSNTALASTAVVAPWASVYGPDGIYGPSTISNLVQLNPLSDPVRSSRWTVTGEPNALFQLSINNGGGFVSLPGNATIDTWKWMSQFGTQSDGPFSLAIITGLGYLNFGIGATLHIPANYAATPGSMSTTFPVHVQY